MSSLTLSNNTNTMHNNYIVTNIEWDISDTDTDTDEIASLPAWVNVSIAVNPNPTEDEIESSISDALADNYGFCVFGFDYEES